MVPAKKKKWPTDHLIKWDGSRRTYNQVKQQISLPCGLGIGRKRKKIIFSKPKALNLQYLLFRRMEPELKIPIFWGESPSISVSIG